MKHDQTLLPVTLFAGHEETADARAAAVQKIEKAALYIESIFNLIRISAETLEDSEESRFQHLGGDIGHLSEIGYGVADSLLKSVLPLMPEETEKTAHDENSPEWEDAGERSETGEEPDEFETADTAGGHTLALLISSLLNNPNLPVAIYNGISDAICDLAFKQDDTKTFDSPEYIEKILRGAAA